MQRHTELSHLVPGGAPVLAPVTGLGALHQQHVGQGVYPGAVGDRLEEVAVDVEPAEGWWGSPLDPAGQGGGVALLHTDVELLVRHLLRLGVGHAVPHGQVEGETLLAGASVAVLHYTEVRVVGVLVVHRRDVELSAGDHDQVQVCNIQKISVRSNSLRVHLPFGQVLVG